MGKKGMILTLVSLAVAGVGSVISSMMMKDEVRKAIAEAKEEKTDETEEEDS